ncbi:unnamed protein product [Owenia fusiformis]|uniref:Uncharacterized protein n=1 Tax=Owenia fusiformis TaxID=6347 RepID=A0A8J1TM02_OWEFU|nr:unnamed protein product [Owenia fusiformis]
MNINTYVKCGDANIKISNEKANINPTDTSHDEPAMNTTSNAHINLEDNAQSCDDTVCENAGANSTDTQCVKDKSKEEDHENESMRLRHDMNHKIFVGNISYRVQREELAEFFSKFGKVVHSYVVKDHVKRWSRGIGFITFASQDGVKKSLGASDEELTLDGRLMRVKPSEESQRVNRHKVTKSVLQHIEDTTSQCQDNEQMQETSPDMAVQFPQDPTNITSLTDDALLTIFSYLDVRHKIKIERVCKRWRQLSIQSWHSAAIIDFSHTFNWRFGGVTDTLLQSLLARGCQNCKVLRLGNRSMCLTDWAVDIIGESCPKLEEVDLSGVEVTNISLKTLGRNCPKLKVIKLQRCHEVGEKGLWWLLKQCQYLHTLDLEGNKRLTGQCFHMAGPYLHILNLSGCSGLSESGILKICEKCKNLEDLKLNACCGLKDESLRALCIGLVHLRRLGLSGDYVELTGQGLYEIGEHLVKLEALNLSGNKAIDDRSLLNICNGCMNLKELDLSCCHSKLRDLNCLGLLYKLELVNLSYMPCVTDDCMRNISQNGRLKRIRLRACSGITNQGITAVLTGCNAIQELDLSGNLQLDNSIFDKLPYSSHKVTITAGGTSIEKETVPNGNITMTMQDLSVLHLRPDRDIALIMDDWDEDELMEHQGDFGDQDNEQYEDNIDDIYDDPLDAERWELS